MDDVRRDVPEVLDYQAATPRLVSRKLRIVLGLCHVLLSSCSFLMLVPWLEVKLTGRGPYGAALFFYILGFGISNFGALLALCVWRQRPVVLGTAIIASALSTPFIGASLLEWLF